MGKFCKFTHDHADYYRCEVCGRMIRCSDPSKIFATCAGKPTRKKFPSVMKQAKNYARAVAQHVASGMAKRSDGEVLRIFEICKACENYEDGLCTVCGCRVNEGQNAFGNKLRMESQHCPLEKW